MTLLPLLATFTFLPGVEFFEPMEVWVDDGVVAVDSTLGEGLPIEPGRGAKFDFELLDGLGRLLQSSGQRGQQFSYVPGSADPLLGTATSGMAEGAERTIWFSPERFPEGLGSLVPPRTELILRLRAQPQIAIGRPNRFSARFQPMTPRSAMKGNPKAR